ncbi:MAG: hypothetical protein EHM47_03335 [Ignavibacteriales bacterium]|nr:MAG: hypothetical protein EHM47_03335 [Ignavibacteriales bacterium]
MKKYLFLILVFAFGFTANHLYDKKVKSLLTQMKMSEDMAEMTIFSNLSGPSFYIPSASELKKIAMGERPSMVLTAAEYIKTQTTTPGFVKKYNEYREMKKPSAPEKPQPMSEMKEQYRKQIEESIANTDKMIQQMPDMKATFEESKKSMQQQLADLDDPNNTMFSPDMDKLMMDSYNQQMDIYNQRVAEWEEEYPVNNPDYMVKKWLNSFLEISGGVDYNAETKEVNGKKVFVNQNYERKDYMWKFCYRSGKETVETARTFAQKWLSELK